ncbi:hypothetical protein HLI_20395 [Halobacillus litoralis]|uniref:Uncharacterized protein n=1 Tax=Halobacillus litoralis TaxID=45668 RepID=A0A410MI52_9BACI|nr:hypothetical protein HLI_20395 [Halobacillus litoralis]
MVLSGILLLLSNADDTFHMNDLPYMLIIVGLMLIITVTILLQKESSLLCRVGFHKYERIGWDEEMPNLEVVKCQRCNKEKKVMRTF